MTYKDPIKLFKRIITVWSEKDEGKMNLKVASGPLNFYEYKENHSAANISYFCKMKMGQRAKSKVSMTDSLLESISCPQSRD